MTVPPLVFFTVTNQLEVVQTDYIDPTGNQPTVMPISGTATFTPCDAKGNPLPEIDSPTQDQTVMIDPIHGRFNVNLVDGTPDGILRALNGTAGVGLVDNQNIDLVPGGLTYRVDYSNVVFDQIGDRFISSFWFAAPGDGSTVDLNKVARLQF